MLLTRSTSIYALNAGKNAWLERRIRMGRHSIQRKNKDNDGTNKDNDGTILNTVQMIESYYMLYLC